MVHIPDEAEIGARIRELRENLRLSQGDLGKMVGASQGAVSWWENAKSAPDSVTLVKLARALKTDVLYLLGQPTKAIDIDKDTSGRAQRIREHVTAIMHELHQQRGDGDGKRKKGGD